MQNVNTNWLEIGREIFLYQSCDFYLYQTACLLEIPNESFSSTEDDLIYHLGADLVVLKAVPMRSLVIQKALNNALAEAKESSTISLISKKLEELLDLTVEAKAELFSKIGTVDRDVSIEKLFFHLSSSNEKLVHFKEDSLDLAGDYFCREICKEFACFPNIKSLNLSNCNLTDSDLSFLQSLSQLKSLNLSNNPVSSIGLRNLNAYLIEELNLANTNFNASGTMQLRKFHSLRSLTLPSTFDQLSMDSLSSSLINCYITRE